MTQPRPSSDELLEAVRAFLDDELLPTLEGRLRFHTRVAVNVLDIVRRELADGPAADAAERDRLVALLGREGSLDELATVLAQGLRAGDVDPGDPHVLDHLRRTAATDVAIANPRYVDGD